MTQSWFLVALSAAYLALLFVIARAGDRRARRHGVPKARPVVYALGFTVYCTSWSIYGTTTQTGNTGWIFPPTYIGTILLFLFFGPVLLKLVRTAKDQNLTSIADFVSSRYGKSQSLAVLATVVAVFCAVPYIALQLKAVNESFNIISGSAASGSVDAGLLVALMMGVFAILFGSRPIASDGPNHGLMLAISFEAVFKLIALAAVGFYAMAVLSGPAPETASIAPPPPHVPQDGIGPYAFLASIVLGITSMICLPRQFHVLTVENSRREDLRVSRMILIGYLIVMGGLIWPITQAAQQAVPGVTTTGYHALALPLESGAKGLALFVYLGGLSAATSMVIMSTVALGIMLGNEIAVPALLKRRLLSDARPADFSPALRAIRRWSIGIILILALIYYRVLADAEQLAAIGLMSMALAAQFAPAVLGGLYWPKGHARGAFGAIAAGSLIWAYTLLLPSLARIGWIDIQLIEQGPLGIAWLSPVGLFGLQGVDTIAHGLFASLSVNIILYITLSLSARHSPLQNIQAQTFAGPPEDVRGPGKTPRIPTGELTRLIGRFIGMETSERAFERYFATRPSSGAPPEVADAATLDFAERLLAGAIGSASARVMLGATGGNAALRVPDVVSLADEASKVFRFNRDLLQATMDNVSTAISVVDKNLRLVAWNRAYETRFRYPPGFLYEGRHVRDLIRYNAERGECGPGDADTHIAKRLAHLEAGTAYSLQRQRKDGTVLEIAGNPMPGGGFVTSYTDITAYKKAEAALINANETLESRVADRTRALTDMNAALARAKAEAEMANRSKTQFFATVSHDVLQPLNAARLFTAALQQRNADPALTEPMARLDASLNSVQDLLDEVLDLHKLDSGRVEARQEDFALAPLLNDLTAEYSAVAAAKGLTLSCVPTSLWIRSDRQHLRRIVQNLLSNAIRYTDQGRVLLGARRSGERTRIEVWDTGRGIPASETERIFGEFNRAHRCGTHDGEGLGLGLAIVDRLSRLLGHSVDVSSVYGQGSVFSVSVPRVEARAEAPAAVAPPVDGPLAGATVLCVDDNENALDGLCALLEGWQCRPIGARSGAEALEHAQHMGGPPDLILADFHLTDGETGLGAYRRLRAHWADPPPCIILSADGTQEVRGEVAAEGLHFMSKPAKAAALRALMHRMLHTARYRPSGSATGTS